MSNALHKAAKRGDIGEITRLIRDEHLDPNELHSKHQTPPIAWAAQHGNVEALKKLVELGADVHYDITENTPLMHYAIKSDKWIEVVHYLKSMGLEFHPNIESLNTGRTTLLYAAQVNNWQLVKDFITFFPDVDINAKYKNGIFEGRNTIWFAAQNNQYDVVKTILEKFSDLDINTVAKKGVHKGRSLLFLLAVLKQWDLIDEILKKYPHADVNAVPSENPDKNLSVLWILGYYKQWKIVDEIIKNKLEADVNICMNEGIHAGITILWIAAISHKWQTVEDIVKKHPEANVNATALFPEDNRKGKTVLWFIASARQWKILHYILKNWSLKSIDLISLLSAPNTEPSVFKLALGCNDKQLKDEIINQILTRLILIKKPEQFSEIKVLLNELTQDLSNEEKQYIDNQMLKIEKEYQLINDVILSETVSSSLDNLPNELKCLIAKNCFHELTGLQDELKFKLMDQFRMMHQQEEIKNYHAKLEKLAKLCFRKWRHNHANLFLFQRPTRSSITDIYANLLECFMDKLNPATNAAFNRRFNISSNSALFISPMLKTEIINRIGLLNFEDLHQVQFEKTIDEIIQGASNKVCHKP